MQIGRRAFRAAVLDVVRQDCEKLSKQVRLSDAHLVYWDSRWLTRVLGMQSNADGSKDRYYILRAVNLFSGILIPALVSLNLSGFGGQAVKWTTLALSVVAGLSVATSELLRPGERWRLNRTYQPLLYREGLYFATLAGKYRQASDHEAVFAEFVQSVEQILQDFEAGYHQQILQPHKELNDGKKESG